MPETVIYNMMKFWIPDEKFIGNLEKRICGKGIAIYRYRSCKICHYAIYSITVCGFAGGKVCENGGVRFVPCAPFHSVFSKFQFCGKCVMNLKGKPVGF